MASNPLRRKIQIERLQAVSSGKMTVQQAFPAKCGTIWIKTDNPDLYRSGAGEILTLAQIEAINISPFSFQLIVV